MGSLQLRRRRFKHSRLNHAPTPRGARPRAGRIPASQRVTTGPRWRGHRSPRWQAANPRLVQVPTVGELSVRCDRGCVSASPSASRARANSSSSWVRRAAVPRRSPRPASSSRRRLTICTRRAPTDPLCPFKLCAARCNVFVSPPLAADRNRLRRQRRPVCRLPGQRDRQRLPCSGRCHRRPVRVR